MENSSQKLAENISRFFEQTFNQIAERYGAMTARLGGSKTPEKKANSLRCFCGYKLCSIFLLLLSFLFIGVAVLIHLEFDSFFDAAVKDQVHLGPGGLVFPKWKVSELRTNMRVYFFNITNPDDVLLGHRPILTEVGPYTWKIYMEKFDISFHNNFTLSYKEKKWFEFLPDESIGGYDDLITTVNVPYAAVAARLKDAGSFAKGVATFTLGTIGQTVIHSHRVGALTFEGYPDFLVLVANSVESARQNTGFGSFFGAGISVLSNVLGSTQTQQEVTNHFGYFIDRNNSDDGLITIFTGEDDRLKINKVNVVDGKTELDTWPLESCNKITGTMGHLRPPLSGTKPVNIFVPDMCRSMALHYEKMSSYEGLSTIRFTAGRDTFNNTSPDACYAGKKKLKSGVMDIGPCKKGAPLVISFPHYLHADESHIDSVVGMQPDKEKHQFYLESDPLSGVTLSVRARLQVGVAMERVYGLGNLGSVFDGNIPLFWQELQLEALPPTVNQLSLLRSLPEYAKHAAVALIVLAICTGFAAVFLAYRDWKRNRVTPVPAEEPEKAYTNSMYMGDVHEMKDDHIKEVEKELNRRNSAKPGQPL